MLEQLNQMNWADVKHAYGPATDVPKDIQNLASQDKKVRGKAMYNLCGNIFHQGTRYEATPYAIPFLLELLSSDTVQEKEEIILLLVNLALGYEDEYLPQGVDPEQFRNDLLASEAKVTEEQRVNQKKFGFSYPALIQCYDIVQSGIPQLYAFLEADEPDLRNSAVFAMAWFPELAAQSLPKVLQYLERSKVEMDHCHAILSAGLLARNSPEGQDISPLRPYLAHESLLVRTCAAIALATNPLTPEVLQRLIEGITDDESLNFVEGIYFNEGRIGGYASLTLSNFGKQEKETIIPALCQNLVSANTYQSLDITRAILVILNSDRSQGIRHVGLNDLQVVEIAALKAIYQHGGWTIDGSEFVNYMNLLQSAGLPHTREDLGKYLGL